MTSRGRHRLAASVLVAAMSTACGGGGGESGSEHARVVEPRPSSTTSSAVRRGPAPVVAPRPAGDRAPVVIDRGADHIAIARSLVIFGRWLDAHDPDPTLVERAYAPTSVLARNVAREVTALQRGRARLNEVDRAPLDFVVASELADVVSFRVTEHLARRELVDAHGRVLEHVGPATEHYVISVMRFGSDGPWRLNFIERQRSSVEVQL